MRVNDKNIPAGEILIYETKDGNARVECRFIDESLWLSQSLIAELFGVSVKTANEHLKNIYDSGELHPEATIRKFRIVQFEGSREVARNIDHYNLEAILAVGYRVRSARGSQFRRWASARLQEYLVKGFTMDDERLKNPPAPDRGIPDYFDELLERIRDIRTSEARMYLRVREIFALAGDYQTANKETGRFFQKIQNKLHFAATGKTVAELIKDRANHILPNMGLTSFKGKQVAKADTRTAKNYLSKDEISELNRIVTMWLDFAEDQAKRRRQVYMKALPPRAAHFWRGKASALQLRLWKPWRKQPQNKSKGRRMKLKFKVQPHQTNAIFFVNVEPYDLIACFDLGLTEELVKKLATHKPVRVVFRDNGFVSDAVKINVDQIFRQLCPATEVKSI